MVDSVVTNWECSKCGAILSSRDLYKHQCHLCRRCKRVYVLSDRKKPLCPTCRAGIVPCKDHKKAKSGLADTLNDDPYGREHIR